MIKYLFIFWVFTLLFFGSGFVSAQNQSQLNLAQQMYDSGDYEKALSLYQKLYQDKEHTDFYFEGYLNVLLKLKKFDEAEKIALRERKANYKNGIALGRLYLEKGEVDKANKAFDQVLAAMPKDEFAVAELANAFYAIGNFDYAIKTFLEGRKVLKDDYAFSFELINLYRYKKLKTELTIEILKVLENQPEFLTQAKSNFSRSYESDEDYNVLKSLVLKKIQKDAQNTAYVNLLAWVYLQQKQYEFALAQLIALDKRSGDNGSYVFSLAQILEENKAYDAAEKAYNYLLTKTENSSYYITSRVALLRLKNKQINSSGVANTSFNDLAASYEKLLHDYGKNSKTVFAVSALANLKAFHLNQPEEAATLLEESLNYPGVSPSVLGQVKLDLATIYILNNQPWDAALLYGQVEKSLAGHPLGQEAKYKSAKLSFYLGDFNWAKAQLDVLKASTSQLIANDALDLSLLIEDGINTDSAGKALKLYARADFFQFKTEPELSLQTLDSIAILYPQSELLDDVLMLKADIKIKQKEYQLAKETLNSIITNHQNSIWADDALFKLAIIEEENLQDLPAAKKLYEKLLNDFPGSLFAAEARKRFRNLRGDVL